MGRFKVYVTDTVDNLIDEWEGDGVFVSITDKKKADGKICCDGFNGLEMCAWLLSIVDEVEDFVESKPDVKLAMTLAELMTETMDDEKGEN